MDCRWHGLRWYWNGALLFPLAWALGEGGVFLRMVGFGSIDIKEREREDIRWFACCIGVGWCLDAEADTDLTMRYGMFVTSND